MPDDIRRQLDAVLDWIEAKIDEVEREAAEKRTAILETAGIPVEMWERLRRRDSRLPLPAQSATIRNMAQGQTATSTKKPAKVRKNGEGAAKYRNPDGLARELGFADIEEMAEIMGQKRVTARTWRSRGYIPPHLNPQVDALRVARAKRTQ